MFLEEVSRAVASFAGEKDITNLKRATIHIFAFVDANVVLNDKSHILPKLFETLETVFRGCPELMDITLIPSDIHFGFWPLPESSAVSLQTMSLLKWTIAYALSLVLKCSNRPPAVMQSIRLFITRLTHVLNLRGRQKKHFLDLSQATTRTIDTHLKKLSYSGNLNGPDFYVSLFQVVHLCSIFNDFDIASKLYLFLPQWQLRFDNYFRKTWFILSELESHPLLDDLKVVILHSLTDRLVIDSNRTWNQISTLLTWQGELITDCNHSTSKSLINSICYCLLKLYKLCQDTGISNKFVENPKLKLIINEFVAVFGTSARLSPNLAELPPSIRKSINIIIYCHSVQTNNAELTNLFRTSESNQYVIVPFKDTLLAVIQSQLIPIDKNNEDDQKFALLRFLDGNKVNSLSELKDRNGKFSLLKIVKKLEILDKAVTSPVLFEEHLPQAYTLISALGYFICIHGNTFDFTTESCTVCEPNALQKDKYSDIRKTRKAIKEVKEISHLYVSLVQFSMKCVQLDLLLSNVLMTLYKLFSSYVPLLNHTPFFEENLSLFLKHRNRDVRLLASRLVPLYLIRERGDELETTFNSLFTQLSKTDFRNHKHLAESTIRCFVEMAIVSEGEHLYVLLIKLIDLLGEPNDQHVNYVYLGFLSVANAKSMTPYKLLSPYMPTIAELVIKRPRMFTKVIELLNWMPEYFLARTKEYTLPNLLEYYKRDYVQEIADACKMTKWRLLAKNLSRICAYYLVRDEINEQYIIQLLANASPEFRSLKMKELITNTGEVTWYILLKIQIDEEKDLFVNKKQIESALEFVSNIHIKQTLGESKSQKDFNRIKYLLDEHVLELVQRFSESVHNIKGAKPYLERVGALRAINYLIEKSMESATTALGQISTCLQATLETPEFEFLAMKCWSNLVNNLNPQNFLSLFDIIISLIFQKFESFQSETKNLAIGILRKLFGIIRTNYAEYGYSLYYLSVPFVTSIQTFQPIREFSLVKPAKRVNYFFEFTRRLQTKNKYVVQQALDDLFNYLTKYQQQCQDLIFKDPSLEESISCLVREILDTSNNFKNTEIAYSCAKVLSAMGSLDVNKFLFKSIKRNIILLFDFTDYKETAEFLIDFIESKLLKIFWASNDPIKQLFSAYSMQVFLQIMRLDTRVLNPKSQDFLVVTWQKFSDISKSTLIPLLSSKYVAPEPKFEKIPIPYHNVSMRYLSWLVGFTSYLLKKNLETMNGNKAEANKAQIFKACSMLIRDEDVFISTHVLKFACLSHIICNDEKDILQEFLQILETNVENRSPDQRELFKNCCESIFEVLDYILEYVATARQYMNEMDLKTESEKRMTKNILAAINFLEAIPTKLLAEKAVQCDSYERSILYLERGLSLEHLQQDHLVDGQNIVATLQNMYTNISDYDALNGVLKVFSSNNLKEKLETFQYNENWSLAQESFLALGDTIDYNTKIANKTKLLKSLSEHGHFEEALDTLTVLVDSDFTTTDSRIKSLPFEWAMVGLEAASGIGNVASIKKWKYVADLIGKPADVETLVDYELAKGFLSLSESDMSGFYESIKKIQELVGNSLAPSLSYSFARNSSFMNVLHMVFDMDLSVRPAEDHIFERLTVERRELHKLRMSNVDQGFNTQFQLLMGLIATSTVLKEPVGDLFIDCSRIARDHNRLDIATKCITRAMALNNPEASTEYAQLLWAQGRQAEAIKCYYDILSDNVFSNKRQQAEVQLQYAEWLDESNHSSSSTIIEEYSKALSIDMWDRPYYDLGKFYNRLLDSTEDLNGFHELQLVRNFLTSLAIGHSYIFQALPKLITVWLDFAQGYKKMNKDKLRRLELMVEDVRKIGKSIPKYVWYTSITQLLSRIVHEHEPSYNLLAEYVSLVIEMYPKHGLWFILSHLNSKDVVRKNNVMHILKKLPKLSDHITAARSLFEDFISIITYQVPKSLRAKRLSLNKDLQITSLNTPSNCLVIPVRSNLEIRLPSSGQVPKQFVAFSKSSSITFDGFDDNIVIFHSLQKPKQVTIRGSDMKVYRLMVKNDDTSKDAKVVEFTTTINRLLKASNEARRRNLVIANYSVIPLADRMGVIEFVSDVATMKSIVVEQRKRLGLKADDRKVFHKLIQLQAFLKQRPSSKSGYQPKPVDKARSEFSELFDFYKRACQEFPPVLHRWLIDQFSDPASWYLARSSFTRSASVMSMVGYIIGLGDRHCENILFFKKSGLVLHIDFECLFEKGKLLPVPELVPFRLTPNLVNAMGITGVEGSFRIGCEVTGKILRDNEASLMNILETILYDPLLEWDSANPRESLRMVTRKIRGLINEKEGLPMNIHGQVDVLIQEASAEESLCQMYGGWSPYV